MTLLANTARMLLEQVGMIIAQFATLKLENAYNA